MSTIYADIIKYEDARLVLHYIKSYLASGSMPLDRDAREQMAVAIGTWLDATRPNVAITPEAFGALADPTTTRSETHGPWPQEPSQTYRETIEPRVGWGYDNPSPLAAPQDGPWPRRGSGDSDEAA